MVTCHIQLRGPHHAHDLDVHMAALLEAVHGEGELRDDVTHAVHDLLHACMAVVVPW